MMRRVVGSSLRFRLVVVAVAAGLMAFGVTQLRAAPRDLYPEFAPTYVEVQTEALGLSAAEVEQFITVPFESYLLNGVAWLETIRSESVPGLSSIVLVFEPGTDLLQARQMVQERLTQASFLPRVSKAPVMLQPVSSTSRAMVIGMSSENVSLIDMGVLARWNIKPRLMGLPGVANVSVWGARDRQLQVQVDPARLRAAGVSLDQIIETTGNALSVSSLTFLEASTPGTGGFIDGPNQRLGIRHVSPIRTPEDLANITLEGCTGGTKPPRHVDANCPAPPESGPPAGAVVNANSGALATPEGRPLQPDGTPPPRLGDVTTVVEDHQPLIGDAVVNDGKGLLLVVEKLPWANSVDVTREVESALAALQPGLEGVEFDPTIFRLASFIDRAVDNLTVTALIALGLIVLALAALLFRWRTAFVALVAIPLSLLAAALVLHLRGTTFNALVFAGLVVAAGAAVDDAVTSVHAMTRRLREQPHDGAGTAITGDSPQAAGKFGVILEAALEARGALLFATLVIIAPLVPVFFMDSLTGSLLRPAATSYALALFASFAVALTVTPALGLLVLRSGPLAGESPALGWLQRRYEGLATRFVRSPRPVVLAGVVLVVAGVAVLPFLRQTTVPEFKETDLLVDFDAAPGTSLQAMERMTAAAGRDLRALPGVRNVGAHVGRAIMSDEVAGANSGELWVSLDPDADYDATVASIQGVVDGYRGVATNVVTYPEHRIAELLDTAPEPVVV
ncbi:MAG: efflux RND transporter permease subunit, partial [Acidimicrobiia bacterium]